MVNSNANLALTPFLARAAYEHHPGLRAAWFGSAGRLRPDDDHPSARALLPHYDPAIHAVDPALPLHPRLLDVGGL